MTDQPTNRQTKRVIELRARNQKKKKVNNKGRVEEEKKNEKKKQTFDK